jgi:protein-S-isoprenylcysteine O-methyltransferase Ste14
MTDLAPSPEAVATTEPTAQSAPNAASRLLIFVYGVVCYSIFFVTFCYAIGFVGNWLVPKSIDSGTAGALLPAVLINVGLMSLFAVQHTIMARPAFKRWWTRFIPAPMERSTFVLLASLILLLLFWQWRPLPQTIWSFDSPVSRGLLVTLSLAGWLFALLSTCMVDHFDLFGLRQVWLHLRGKAYRPTGFRLVGFYKVVRHPIMLGFLIAFWATPHMSLGHLLFAGVITGYVIFGTTIEERDLVGYFGEQYREYRRHVPGLLPLPRLRRSGAQ